MASAEKTTVTVDINNEEKFRRWHDGAGQGGLCPATEDADAVIAALEDALETARAMKCTGKLLEFEPNTSGYER